jgi:hypothetical protein
MGRGSRNAYDATAAAMASARDIGDLLAARRNSAAARPTWISGQLPDSMRWVGPDEEARVRAAQGGRLPRLAPKVGEEITVNREALLDAIRNDPSHPLRATTTTQEVQAAQWTDPGKFGTVTVVAVDVRELQRADGKASTIVAPDGFVWVENQWIVLPQGVHRVYAHDLELRSARTQGKRFGPMSRRERA